MTLIAIPILARTTEDALNAMATLSDVADLFELRVDAMDECDLPSIVAARERPLIVTNRAANEGGLKKQDEADRLAALAEAVGLGADYVDVELASLPAFEQLVPPAQRGDTQSIVSFHDTEAMPDDLPQTARTIEGTSADVVKVVGTALRPEDNLKVFEAMAAVGKPVIGLAMGEHGRMSRILAGKFGGMLTFASAATGAESALGQITVQEMRHLYRADHVGPATAVYAVMGNPVEHSLSPAIHNAAFLAEGLDAVYLRIKVEDDPAEVVRAMSAIPIDGYSVTIPHKESVMAACAEIDPISRTMRAVNTLVRRDGAYHATNTDVTSAMKVLAGALGTDDFTGKRALVLGAGGVGRAYVHGLVGRGAEVMVTDIDAERRAAVAAEAGATAIEIDAVDTTPIDILMNATPIGMWPKVNASPVDAAVFRPDMIVFDAVYNPQQTQMLRDAAPAGATTIRGVEQFVGQAVEQFELWTGRPAPVDIMRQVVLDALAIE